MKEERIRLIGYPISSEKYGERDAIVSFFCVDKLRTLKVSSGYLPTGKNHQVTLLFNQIEVEVGSKSGKYFGVRGSTTLTNNVGLYEDLQKITLLNFEREIIMKMFTEEDELPYEWFEKSIEMMKKEYDVISMALIFLAQALTLIGSKPMTQGCNICGKATNIVHFSMNDGGFICNSCARDNDLSFDAPIYLKTMKYIFNVTPSTIVDKKLPHEVALQCLNELLDYVRDNYNLIIRTTEMLLSLGK